MTRRILISVAVFFALMIFLRLLMHGDLGLGGREVLSATSKSLAVNTVLVRHEVEYTTHRQYTGTVRARRDSELGFEHAGRVIAIHVEAGDEVRAGQALARLDGRQLEARRKALVAERAQAFAVLQELQAGPRQEAIAQARSRIQDLEEQLRLFGVKRVRAERLFKEQVVAEDALDDAASMEKQLTARLEEARQALEEHLAGTRPERIRAQEAAVEHLDGLLELVDVHIENSTLRAPFDGVVAERRIDEGSVVAAGETVVRVLESAAPEAWVGVPVVMAKSVVPGRKYTLEIGGAEHSATALQVLPEIDAATRCVSAVFELEDSEIEVFPGQVVRLALERTVAEEGMWIPTTALTRGLRGLWNCYAVVEATSPGGAQRGRYLVERRQVEVLHAEGDRVYVRGTLRDGERIVSEGTHRLVAGQPVTPNEVEI